MRYKFRAYEKSTGKMYNCFGFNRLENEIYISSIAIDDFIEGVLETVHSVTKRLNEYVIVEYTGLTDKNDVDIYEGHIIRLGSFLQENYKKVIGQVVFERGKYIFYDNDIFKCDLDSMGITLEVIGNIYQHKHLLKENELC